MSVEENKAIVRRYIEEVLNNGNLGAVDELFAPEMHEMVKQIAASFLAAFPDRHETIEALVADGDRVVACWTWHGTHLGEFEGIPATGRQITRTGMAFYHLRGGKIIEDWAEWDWLDLLEQLGDWGEWDWLDLLKHMEARP
jgi:steroid delta-isomerase-like uncharacterized protein